MLLGNVASVVGVVLAGYGSEQSDSWPTWVVAVSVVPMWATFLVLMPRFARIPPLEFRSVPRWFTVSDVLVGVPVGVLSQLVLVNLVNWPLSRVFPDSFSFDEVSKRAQGMTESASGAWLILLILIVVVGAPFVEEYVYRGTLQPAVEARFGPTTAVVGVAVVFAAVHLQPVEFPGLLAVALVLGVARRRGGTLGLPIMVHLAFNATGLALVMLT